MTQQELTEKISLIQTKANDEIKSLKLSFAKEHNNFKEGDIIENNSGDRIKIHSIQYVLDMSVFGKPIAAYNGNPYTKQNKPKKHGMPIRIYQFNSECLEVKKITP